MDKLYIYGGLTVGGIVGSYLPVLLLGSSPLGAVSIVGGVVGSLIGLLIGYKAYTSYGE